MIDVKQIKEIEGLYKNKDFYFVDVLIERGFMVLRVRYQYKLEAQARLAKTALQDRKIQDIPEPDVKPSIFAVGGVRER